MPGCPGKSLVGPHRKSAIMRALAAQIAGFVVLAGALACQAETWPSRPIRLIVPFSAGGTADLLARVIAPVLTVRLGQPVVVDNRGGAGGLTASAQVANADADGYTLVVSGVASHIIAPALSPRPEYDPIKQFTHIAYFGGPPIVWVVHPSLGVRSFDQLLKLVGTAPEPLSYGSPGVGTQGHLVAAILAGKLGLPLVHVGYKGASPAMLDLIGGHIKLASVTWTTALAHIQSGAILPIAVTAKTRVRDFPELPTFAELGYPDLVATVWFSLSGPPGLPPAVVDRLNREIVRAFELPDVRARLLQESIDGESMDAATFTKFMEQENARWAPIAKAIVARQK